MIILNNNKMVKKIFYFDRKLVNYLKVITRIK